MAKESAGILVFKHGPEGVHVLLVHPAGPFWAHKDTWSIPKGELDDSEDHKAAAYREFQEEVGITLDTKLPLFDLGTAKQSNGKVNYIWAVETDVDLAQYSCNTFTMEWPPRTGNMQEFPENDRADWFDLATAKRKLFQNQTVFIDRLADHLGENIDDTDVHPQQSR